MERGRGPVCPLLSVPPAFGLTGIPSWVRSSIRVSGNLSFLRLLLIVRDSVFR